MLEFKINGYQDRMSMVQALVNSGYGVKVREERNKNRLASSDYYVQVLDMPKEFKCQSCKDTVMVYNVFKEEKVKCYECNKE